MNMIPMLQLLIGLIFMVMIILIVILIYISRPKQEKNELITSENNQNLNKDKKIQNYGRFQADLPPDSIMDFLEFDEIVDNMIVRKKGTQYVMILQCNGVNYDLMSEQEKIGVEEGFVQFLNTLRFPVQLYVQSRTLNLRDIIATYKERVDTLGSEIEKLDAKIAQAKAQGNKAVKEKLEFERRRKVNVLEYGINITDYVEKLSSNQNILQQKTYVVISYYSAEIGGNIENFSKEEIYNMCFSELYTRCQNLASSLANSQITSKILDSEELSELLYIAYNRDESELLQFSKALDAQYDSLYTTGKDVLQKKQEKLDREINLEAIDVTAASILKADRKKQQEDIMQQFDKDQKVRERAIELLENYEEQLDPKVYKMAKNEINKTIDERQNKPVNQEENQELSKRKVLKRRATDN